VADCRRVEAPKRDALAIERGRRLFVENCSICHGRGDGHGIRNQGLFPRPPDFTDAQWQHTHPEGEVSKSIREGVTGTAMPSWRALGEQQIRDLAAFVKSLS
jgi:mono/diheme cytochrome c family protein